MKILFIHKFLEVKGGAEKSMMTLAKIMEELGHEVFFMGMQTENIDPYIQGRYVTVSPINFNGVITEKIKYGARMLWGHESNIVLEKTIKKYSPDVIHVDSVYHQISPSIFHVLKKYNIPVVVHLRDYKLICPNYKLYVAHKSTTCEECKGHKYYQTILNKCMKNGYFGSFFGMCEGYLHNVLLKSYQKATVFASPSKFLISKFKEFAFPRDIYYLPNVEITEIKPCALNKKSNIFSYIGRLSEEKGLHTLIKSFIDKKYLELKIVGTGPIEDELIKFVKDNKLGNVHFTGHLDHDNVLKIMSESIATIVPSEWYENNPRTVFESFKVGRSVIGANIGGIPELVRDGETGLLFEAGNVDQLSSCVDKLFNDKDLAIQLGKNAEVFVNEEFGKVQYIKRLKIMYNSFGVKL